MMGAGEISAYKSFIVRDGSRIRFWHDVGVVNRPQKNCFQIVFDRLALLMESKFHLRF